MSGLDVAAIHTALADQIRSGIGASSGFTVKAFPSTAKRPCIEVWPEPGDFIGYFSSFGPSGIADLAVVVRVFLAGANPETEWMQAARLLSAGSDHPSSIADAVVADATLGGVVQTSRVLNARWNPEEGSIDIPVQISAKKSGASA